MPEEREGGREGEETRETVRNEGGGREGERERGKMKGMERQ